MLTRSDKAVTVTLLPVVLAAEIIAYTDRMPRTWDCNSHLGCPCTEVINSMTSLFNILSKRLHSRHLQPVLTQSLTNTLLEFLQLVVHQQRSPHHSSNFLGNYRRHLTSLQAKRSLLSLRNQRGDIHSRKNRCEPKGDLCPWA